MEADLKYNKEYCITYPPTKMVCEVNNDGNITMKGVPDLESRCRRGKLYKEHEQWKTTIKQKF